jgi:hypothetical protein
MSLGLKQLAALRIMVAFSEHTVYITGADAQ